MIESHSTINLSGKELPLKHLDKCYDGDITKAEVISYYIDMAKYLLPHIYDKPFTMIHFPDGVGGKSFYQKQCPVGAPDWLKTARLKSSTRGSINWCLVNDTASIVYMAGRSVIEMHTWFSRLPDLKRPDIAVIDLDPSGLTGFDEALFIADAFGVLLKQLGVYSVPKTTGSRGIHIYIPIRPVPFDEVKSFLNRLCYIIMSTYPKLATTERAVNRRGDRVYLDAVQNGEGKTIAAPYSLRARGGLPVAAPLYWDEIKQGGITPKDFNIRNISQRILRVGDIFEGFYNRPQDLPKI